MVVKPKCRHFTWILLNWATTGDVMMDQEGKLLNSRGFLNISLHYKFFSSAFAVHLIHSSQIDEEKKNFACNYQQLHVVEASIILVELTHIQ